MEKMTLLFLTSLLAGILAVHAGDPTFTFDWNVTYGTISPLGIPQQVILINGQFPGPLINCTSNNNIVVNVINNLDEPFLITWSGVQQRKNSWQDGVLGTNCPIPPGKNYTYRFQVKDQIGSFMYYPSTALHKAAGGFGIIFINSRNLIPVPYDKPTADFDVIINDWYTKSHSVIRNLLDGGRSLGRPAGVLINGKAGKPEGKPVPMFTMSANKTYRYRICNTGLKTSLNIRIQGHKMKLVEMEGSHVMQNDYESLDVHVGQCYTVLVTANQTPKDYYLVVSTRFLKQVLTSTAVINYAEGKGTPASPELPKAPIGWSFSLNQFRSFRWNLTSSAARPNPQGSYKYGKINITRTIKLANTASKEGGKLRYAINGVSHVNPITPLKLAQYYKISDQVFKMNSIQDEPAAEITKVIEQPNVINITYRDFIEIIFENREKSVQSYHVDGYSFFAVG